MVPLQRNLYYSYTTKETKVVLCVTFIWACQSLNNSNPNISIFLWDFTAELTKFLRTISRGRIWGPKYGKKSFLCSKLSLLSARTAPRQGIVFAVAFTSGCWVSWGGCLSYNIGGFGFLFFHNSSLVPKKVVWEPKKWAAKALVRLKNKHKL